MAYSKTSFLEALDSSGFMNEPNSTISNKISYILGNDSMLLLENIEYMRDSISSARIILKKNLQTKHILKIKNEESNINELIKTHDFDNKMKNDENFLIFILNHPFLKYCTEYDKIIKTYKPILVNRINSLMKNNTSHKITLCEENELIDEEDEFSDQY